MIVSIFSVISSDLITEGKALVAFEWQCYYTTLPMLADPGLKLSKCIANMQTDIQKVIFINKIIL